MTEVRAEEEYGHLPEIVVITFRTESEINTGPSLRLKLSNTKMDTLFTAMLLLTIFSVSSQLHLIKKANQEPDRCALVRPSNLYLLFQELMSKTATKEMDKRL